MFLSGESHRQRSLEGYIPWGHKGSDMTEATEYTHMHIYEPNRSRRLLRRGGKNTQKNYTKKNFITQIITMV